MSRIFKIFLLLLTLPGLVWAANAVDLLQTHASSSRTINVGGQIDREGWLGFSVYSSDSKIAPYQHLRKVRPGSLKEALYLEPSYAGGSYEVAIWDQKVSRSQCKVRDCKWCPL